MKVRMHDRSGERVYRYVWEDISRHEQPRVYFKRGTAPKIRMHQTPGSREFEAEYQALMNGNVVELPVVVAGKQAVKVVAAGTKGISAKPARYTLRWLVDQYFGSSAFKTLGPTTQSKRRRVLEHVCATPAGDDANLTTGSAPISAFEARHIAKLRDLKTDAPASANERVIALHILFDWACDPEQKYMDANPAAGIKKLQLKKTGGFATWRPEDIAAFEAHHPIGTMARLALDLLQHTAVRRSDAIKLGPPHERDGKLFFSEEKLKDHVLKEHETPVAPELRRSIDATVTGLQTYLVTDAGKPFTPDSFSQWFKKRCKEALGPNTTLSAHGVRKFVCASLAEEGASSSVIASVIGHSGTKLVDVYTRKADKKRMERDGLAILSRRRNRA